MQQDSSLGVYISVPFCRSKCSFCNFASGVGTQSGLSAYVMQLCSEIRSARSTCAKVGGKLPKRADTVYLGGGTPSLLSPAQLRTIFTALRETFAVDADAEITLEAAPGQIEDDLLDEALKLGVNRVSLGVQSFVDRECVAVGRSHTGNSCTAEISRLRGRGVGEVAADLIAGLPLQTESSWRESLARATETEATHWSVYMFECDDDSRLGREVLSGGARLFAPAVPSGDAAATMYEEACEWMGDHGFPQYEISNFASSAHQSRHNRKYWERKPYIGFGVDAHSMLVDAASSGNAHRCTVRFANADSLESYASGGVGQDLAIVDEVSALEEALFLGLRLNEGVAPADLRGDLTEVKAVVKEMVAAGLMRDDGSRWRLSSQGRMISNEVFERLLCVAA